MPRDIDDLLSDLFGKSSNPRPMRAKSAPSSAESAKPAGSAKPVENISPAETLDRIDDVTRQFSDQLKGQLEEVRRMNAGLNLDAIEKEVEKDFGVIPDSAKEKPKKDIDLADFAGLLDQMKEKIIGQDAFLQKLITAFKRPFVAGFNEKGPKNSIFIWGKKSSGRHSAVELLTRLLHEKGILRSPQIAHVDLSLYSKQGEEKVFLQDLYMALKKEGEVVVFDGIEKCHASLLAKLSSLVTKGKILLSSRYIMNQGRLIEAGNALTPDMIGSVGANGKFLVFISQQNEDKLAESFGAPFVSALGDKCKTDDFSAESLELIAKDKFDFLCQKAQKQLGFTLSCDKDFYPFIAGKYTKEEGIGGIISFCKTIFNALAQYKLEKDAAKADITLSVKEGAVTAKLDDTVIDLLGFLPRRYTGDIDAVKAEMEKIVGLDEIKKYIFSLEDHFKVQQMRKDQGLKNAPISMHMIFTGNPGTGKTTIARLISKYLKAIGVLSGGQLIEVSRADLVGKYVGHTAPLTNQVIKSAIGGVLFIDEAYSLYRGEQDSFGLEAIDTLVKGIEDNRDNLLVVLAGYSREMEDFLSSNSGLRSRFPNLIDFPDYSGEELLEIASIQAKSRGYSLEKEAEDALLDYFNIIQAMDSRDSGNGRLARNVIEKAILEQSRRVLKEADDLTLLRKADFDLFE